MWGKMLNAANKKHVLFNNRKGKYHKTMELLNEYPNIKDLADESIHYMVSQRAMAKYLGLTKQSISRAILSTDAQWGRDFRIYRRPILTKTGKIKNIPIRYYELYVFYLISIHLPSKNSEQVVEALKYTKSRYMIGMEIINKKPREIICLD